MRPLSIDDIAAVLARLKPGLMTRILRFQPFRLAPGDTLFMHPDDVTAFTVVPGSDRWLDDLGVEVRATKYVQRGTVVCVAKSQFDWRRIPRPNRWFHYDPNQRRPIDLVSV